MYTSLYPSPQNMQLTFGIRYNSIDEYTGPGYAEAQAGGNASALGSYYTGTTGSPLPNQASSGVSGDTVYLSYKKDGSSLIPDNIDPEKVIEKDETQEHGGPEDTKKDGDSRGEGRNYSQNSEVEDFSIAPPMQIVDSSEIGVGELLGRVGPSKYVGDEPGVRG